jgi:hypothetical protein
LLEDEGAMPHSPKEPLRVVGGHLDGLGLTDVRRLYAFPGLGIEGERRAEALDAVVTWESCPGRHAKAQHQVADREPEEHPLRRCHRSGWPSTNGAPTSNTLSQPRPR